MTVIRNDFEQPINNYQENLNKVSLLPNLIVGFFFVSFIAVVLYFIQLILFNIFSSYIFR